LLRRNSSSCDHRGDADAASDEQMQARLFDQRKQIDRRRDFDQIAFLDAVVHAPPSRRDRSSTRRTAIW
jgi:hypothetical protein